MPNEQKCLDCGKYIESKHGTLVCSACTQKRITTLDEDIARRRVTTVVTGMDVCVPQLQDELAAVQARSDAWEMDARGLGTAVEALLEERDQQAATIAQLTKALFLSDGPYPSCPVCGRSLADDFTGHENGCEIKAALAQAQPSPSGEAERGTAERAVTVYVVTSNRSGEDIETLEQFEGVNLTLEEAQGSIRKHCDKCAVGAQAWIFGKGRHHCYWHTAPFEEDPGVRVSWWITEHKLVGCEIKAVSWWITEHKLETTP
jgi:hypothetical protein